MKPRFLHCTEGLSFDFLYHSTYVSEIPPDLQAFLFPKRHKRKYERKPCHFPKCACRAFLEVFIRTYRDGSKHLYFYSQACRSTGASPVPRSLFPQSGLVALYRRASREREVRA